MRRKNERILIRGVLTTQRWQPRYIGNGAHNKKASCVLSSSVSDTLDDGELEKYETIFHLGHRGASTECLWSPEDVPRGCPTAER